MKTTKLIAVTLLATTVFTSCKKEEVTEVAPTVIQLLPKSMKSLLLMAIL